MKNKHKYTGYIILIIVLLALIGVTYSFFSPQGQNTITNDVSVTSNTTDLLTFQIENDISFTASEANFYQGGNNVSGSTTATATLVPNNKTREATMNYYMYLNLTSNPITYSNTNINHDPELILQVFDENDQLVTLSGLGIQVSLGSGYGYDITGKSGVITLLNNHAITANGAAKVENWSIVITLVNLGVDQNDNTNKTVTGEVILRKAEIPYCELNSNDNLCNINVNYNPSNNIIELDNGYLYHHNSSLTNGAGDNSYRFAGENPNNYICFGNGATSTGTCQQANLYRIIGLIPVNVVTDSTTNPVTTEQKMLYKIIKNNYVGSTEMPTNVTTYNGDMPTTYNGASYNQASKPAGYRWTGSSGVSTSTWGLSTLNTTGLNSEYLTYIGALWGNKIENVIWKVGGSSINSLTYAGPISSVYNAEILNSGANINNESTYYAPADGNNEYAAKVGLMYVSDYGYAAPQSAWSNATSSYSSSSIASNNWLFRGISEWTITRDTRYSNTVALVVYNGGTGFYYCNYWRIGVRPVFYLKEDTIIDFSNHDGTSLDPYRIS